MLEYLMFDPPHLCNPPPLTNLTNFFWNTFLNFVVDLLLTIFRKKLVRHNELFLEHFFEFPGRPTFDYFGKKW